MRPGPTIIRKCSACEKSITQRTITSGNTFGATYFTDGKRIAPMLPDQPLLVLCPHCRASLWIEELENLGAVRAGGEAQQRWRDARVYETPSRNDYFALLAKGLADPKKERYLRLRAWWAGNDERRTEASEIPLSSIETANLIALAQMLHESDDRDLLQKAEVMRELGRFDDALLLLATSESDKIAQAVTIIKNLALHRDPQVRRMHFSDQRGAQKMQAPGADV